MSQTVETKNEVQIAIKEDNISKRDLLKWYTVYKGAYIWGEELDFIECNNTGTVFDRIRLVRDKIYPSKGNENFTKVVNGINSKYSESDFSQNTKDKMTDDLFYISEGIRLSLENMDE